MNTVPKFLQLLRENKFDDVIPVITQMLRDAAEESPKRLAEVSRDIVRWQGFFKNNDQAMTSEVYFRTVHALLEELAGPDASVTMTAAENLSGILGSIGKVDEAISLREKVLAHLSGRLANDDQRVMIVRDGLAILYRRAGRNKESDELYRNAGVCEHLRLADQHIRGHGARVVSSGQPWSTNCHIWVYFDALLDCDRLIQGLGLDKCVQVHDHRGTHDGSERGIVCTIHNDALMGPHPADASPSTKIVSVP